MKMNRALLVNLLLRVVAVAAGFAVIYAIVHAAGVWLTPYTYSMDKAITAAINPDQYTPGLDQLFRAISDYTNFLIAAPLIAWMIAYGLYRLLPRYKKVFTALLMLTAVTMTLLAALGRMWPNKAYMGANVLLVISVAVAFGTIAWLFHKMDHEAMRRFSRVFWLAFLTVFLSSYYATSRIKKEVARPRPLHGAHSPWNEVLRVIPEEALYGANSYPSGHTSGTFALITPWFWYSRNRKIRAGLFAWATLQGVSRVYTVAHFPFCCLMGGFLSFAIGTLIFFALGGPKLWVDEKTPPLGSET